MNENNENDSDFRNKYSKLLHDMKRDFQNKCPEAEFLNRYFKKEVTNQERQIVKEHLDFCPVCMEVLQRLEKVEQTKDEKLELPKNWQDITEEMDARTYAYLHSINVAKKSEISKIPEVSNIFSKIKDILENNKIEVQRSELTKIPQSTVPISEKDAPKILKVFEALEELDDVQHVYANFDIPDELIEEILAMKEKEQKAKEKKKKSDKKKKKGTKKSKKKKK